jgi:hypothetical protein
LRSNTSTEVRAAKGSSRTNSVAVSVVDSTASRPPMTRMVVEAKNEGLADRFCTTTASSTRLSRAVACHIQRTRSRLVSASTEGRTTERRRANAW